LSDDLATSALLSKLNSFLDSKISKPPAALKLNENLQEPAFKESLTLLNETSWEIRSLASNPNALKGTNSFSKISRAEA
jgi:hypothetical protein